MQADTNRHETVWQFYMSEGVALRALASAAKTQEVRGQLLLIAEMYDQLANFLKGPEIQPPEAQNS
ncbi:MAG TPA: hypothetical protein VGI32_08180 [Steroidobacteraceae bacterium]|jgi:hypothetical protein